MSLETLSTVMFAEHDSGGGGGRTSVTIRWVLFNATEPERRTFEAEHESTQKGWTGILDQFTEYLARA